MAFGRFIRISFCLTIFTVAMVSVSCRRTAEVVELPQERDPGPVRDVPESDAAPLDPGIFYSLRYKGEDYFFNVSYNDGTALRGCFYSVSEAPVASPHIFVASRVKRRYRVSTDEREFRMNPRRCDIAPYVEPDFAPADTSMYRKPFCGFKVIDDVVYGMAPGYWSSLPGVEEDVSKIISGGLMKSFGREDLELTLDLYVPEGVDGPRPLIMFIHGGAFYIGDKKEPAYVDFCSHFASMGYVTASINYRLGFHVGKGEIERAQYAALQDAHAAMRFLVSNADEYGIDTGRLYVAGSSAGSITALGLAFMKEKDRPRASYGGRGLFNRNNMGRIDGAGNEIRAKFHIRAVANMWGAVPSTDILSNSRTSIISFHGTEDTVVPYSEGLPFGDVPEAVSGKLSETMYGSACIDSVARAEGLKSEFYPFPGEGHAFNTMGRSKMPNAYHRIIRGRIADFFFDDIVSGRVHVIDRGDGRYSLDRKIDASGWKAEGGFIISSAPDEAVVLWRGDAPEWKLSATGLYDGGIGFVAGCSPLR